MSIYTLYLNFHIKTIIEEKLISILRYIVLKQGNFTSFDDMQHTKLRSFFFSMAIL
jgi:hypothetical protein